MNQYTIEINGIEHTVLLSDADAKARGLKPTPDAKVVTAAKAEDKAVKKSESK